MLAAENMLKAFEIKENHQEDNNNDRDLGSVLKRFEGASGLDHSGIRYSDGKKRGSSFDD